MNFMNPLRIFLVVALLLTACTHTYYITRHAEKAIVGGNGSMMSNDPPLSEAGQARAKALAAYLQDKQIGLIYSTNTIRTRSTAQPLADKLNLPVNLYGPVPGAGFIDSLIGVKKNVLIIGHSNTVDDFVNGLCKEKKVAGDLHDDEYDHLFVVRVKNFFGRHVRYEDIGYGKIR